jgi:hypothetical protein
MTKNRLAMIGACLMVFALTAVAQDKKPINAKCPVKGEPVKADITTEYEGKVIGFC